MKLNEEMMVWNETNKGDKNLNQSLGGPMNDILPDYHGIKLKEELLINNDKYHQNRYPCQSPEYDGFVLKPYRALRRWFRKKCRMGPGF